jgi:hypothetical protein
MERLIDSSDTGSVWDRISLTFILAILPAAQDKVERAGGQSANLLDYLRVAKAYLRYPRILELLDDPHVSPESKESILERLGSVPGYEHRKGRTQSPMFREQYSYQTMGCTRLLNPVHG